MAFAGNFHNIEAPPPQTDNPSLRGRFLADAQGPLPLRGRRFMVSETLSKSDTLPKLSICGSCGGGHRRLEQMNRRQDRDRLSDKEKPSPEKSKDKTPQTKKEEIAKIVEELLNEKRAKKGLKKVEHSDRQAELATKNTKIQQERNKMGHYLKRSNPGRENAIVVLRTNRSAKAIATEIVNRWMNSSGHKANMLARNVSNVGFDIEGKYATLRLA